MTDPHLEELRWTAWMPLMAAHPLALAQLPSAPGFYRLRHAGDPERLLWIGWEPRGVREIMERLSRQVHLPLEPYDDPSVPARLLWNLRRQRGGAFEVSGAPADLSQQDAEALLSAIRAVYDTKEERHDR